MTEYVLLAVLRHHRDARAYERLQRAGKWEGRPIRQAFERSVGIMGLGALGADAAAHLVDLGFKVNGWSRTPKVLPGVTSFHGGDGLAAVPSAQRDRGLPAAADGGNQRHPQSRYLR